MWIILEWVFNRTLTFNNHIDSIAGKLYHVLWKMSFPSKFQLVNSLLLPFFLSCDVVYSTLDVVSATRLKVIFSDCTRFVYGRRRFVHISDVNASTIDYTFGNYLMFRYLCFSLILFRNPLYLFEKLVFAQSSRLDLSLLIFFEITQTYVTNHCL